MLLLDRIPDFNLMRKLTNFKLQYFVGQLIAVNSFMENL